MSQRAPDPPLVWSEVFFQKHQNVWKLFPWCFATSRMLYFHKSRLNARKTKFFVQYFLSKCEQIHNKLRISSHLLKTTRTENYNFCAVNHKEFLGNIWSLHCSKNEVFHQRFLQWMWPNTRFSADLVIFTEEILNGKLHFLGSERGAENGSLLIQWRPIINSYRNCDELRFTKRRLKKGNFGSKWNKPSNECSVKNCHIFSKFLLNKSWEKFMSNPLTQDANLIFIRRSEDVLNGLCPFNLRPGPRSLHKK